MVRKNENLVWGKSGKSQETFKMRFCGHPVYFNYENKCETILKIFLIVIMQKANAFVGQL